MAPLESHSFRDATTIGNMLPDFQGANEIVQ